MWLAEGMLKPAISCPKSISRLLRGDEKAVRIRT